MHARLFYRYEIQMDFLLIAVLTKLFNFVEPTLHTRYFVSNKKYIWVTTIKVKAFNSTTFNLS